MSTVDERATVTLNQQAPDDAWPYIVNGKVFQVAGHTTGFPLTKDELRNLRDRANELLGDSPFQSGYDLAVANGALVADNGAPVTVNETILDALLLDAKSTYAAKAYLIERGAVFT